MPRLILLRHAKSDRTPGVEDHERPLNARGRNAAPTVGAYLAGEGIIPDLVVCSTAKRTRQTWELVARALPKPPHAEFDETLYLAEEDAIRELVHTLPPAARCAMLIGHNPGLHEVALALIGAGDAAARRKLQAKFPTAALVVIDFPGDDWTAVRPRSGTLERFVTPKGIEEAD